MDIHPTAIIAHGARLGKNVNIGSNVIIGNNCIIGDNVEIQNGCELGTYSASHNDRSVIMACGISAKFTPILNFYIIANDAVISYDNIGADVHIFS